MSLLQIAYISQSRLPEDSGARAREIERISATAHRHNAAHGISGYFAFDGERFAQIIEGEAASVRGTYLRISGDPRHSDIVPLGERAVATRDFEAWTMGFAHLQSLSVTVDSLSAFDQVKKVLIDASAVQGPR